MAALPAITLALALLLAACGGGDDDAGGPTTTIGADLTREAEGPPQPGGTITFGLGAENNNWNPYDGQWAGNAFLVAGAVFDPLTALDADGEVRPYLAESFESNDDFTEWTIALRPDVVFHDGEPLDANAVRDNLEYGRSAALTAAAFAPISAVDVEDELTLTVRMRTPWSTFPLAMAQQTGYMAAPSMLTDPDGARNPVGTGPFEFKEWVIDARLKVEKNERYWQEGLPYLDTIEFRILSDTVTRTQSLFSGETDVIQVAAPGELLSLSEDASEGKVQLITDAGRETDETIIALNTSQPPFDDPDARLALAVGIDQEEISATLWQGAFPPAFGPFAEGSPFYVPPDELDYPDYDLARAQELVADYEARTGEPFRFSALVPPDPVYLSIAEALQAQAAIAGIQVELEALEQTQLITRVLGGDYQAAGFIMWSAPTLDRGYFFIATPPAEEGLSLNFTRNDNERIRDAMDAARATDDVAEQIEQYRIVQEELVKDQDRIFLVHNISGVAFRNDIHGMTSTMIPGTDIPAESAYGPAIPFLTSVWVDRDGS